MAEKRKIMIVVDAPGPAEFIESVIPMLKEKAEMLLVTVNTPAEAAYKVLKKYNPERCDREEDAEAIYRKFDPDVLVVGTSSLVLGPYCINKFTELAHADKKKIICFQDFWANHRHAVNYKMINYWENILAPDELAKKFLMEDGISVDKIIVTGNPNFDRFRVIDKEKDRKWLREKFGLSKNDFLMFWVGRGTPQAAQFEEKTFSFFSKTISTLIKEIGDKKLILTIRPHPRDEHPERYKKYCEGLNLLDTANFPSGDDLLPIADLIVGLTSSHHVQGCYLRIPEICILLPGAGKEMLEKISLADFPPDLVGACVGIYEESEEKLKEVIKKIIYDKNFVAEIKSAQEKYFPLPQTSAVKKVANEILKD